MKHLKETITAIKAVNNTVHAELTEKQLETLFLTFSGKDSVPTVPREIRFFETGCDWSKMKNRPRCYSPVIPLQFSDAYVRFAGNQWYGYFEQTKNGFEPTPLFKEMESIVTNHMEYLSLCEVSCNLF